MRKAILFIIWIIVPINIISAIHTPHSFKHIGVSNGLSNGFIVDMVIDNQGFVWVATEYGLNRFSGNTVLTYTTSNSHISGNELVCLYFCKKRNQIWIGTRQAGISVFCCNTGTFKNYTVKDGLLSLDIADIAEASDGGIWILHRNNGIQHLDFEKGGFSNFPKNKYPILGFQSRVIADDGHHHLYIGHFGSGLSVIDLKTGKMTNYTTHSPKQCDLPSNYIRDVFIDSKKNVWIGTNNGAAIFNPVTKTFLKIPSSLMVGINIHDITEFHDGRIGLAADLGGITILDRSKDKYNASQITADNSALSSPNIRKIKEDKYGNLWIANYSTGIDFMLQSLPVYGIVDFKHKDNVPYKVYSTYRDDDDNVWFGGENMLALYSNGKITQTWDLSPYIRHNQTIVYAISSDKDGNIWLGLNDWGVLKFDRKINSFKTIIEQDLDVHAFCRTEDGKTWIGSGNKLFSYSDDKLYNEPKYNKDLNGSIIYSLMQDSQKRLWVGTLGKGIFVYDKDGNRIVHLNKASGLPSENINQIYMDRQHRIWIATYNGLVLVQDIKRIRNFRIFNEANNLGNNNVRAIIEDLSSNIWVSSFTGVSCLRNGKSQFVNYNYTDGLPEGGFVENGISMQKNGMIYIVSPYGIGFVNSAAAEKDETPSKLQLISMESLNSQNVGHPLFPKNGIIKIPFDENSIRFKFTVENYAQSSTVEYSCMMEGIDKDWQYLGSETSATYKNISPGEYTLKLRVKNKNGEWNNAHILSVRVVVTPPVWLTWYAKFFYIFMLAAASWWLASVYKKRLLLKNKYELQQRYIEIERKRYQDEQNLNDERMRFYTNIAHELRTPLTLIIGPLEDLSDDNRLPSYFASQIRNIHGHAMRLLNLINQILEFRKTETQNKELNVSKESITKTVTEIGLRYKELLRNKDVDFILSVKQLELNIYFDKDVITTIINNLLSNAIKYTNHGHIKLSLDTCEYNSSKYVKISVEDTGYGINADVLPHIFDRYYQAKGKHQASGTGIGLALVKSLVELHKGLLQVESIPDSGSTFSFLLKMTETYPDALHAEESSPMTVINETHREETDNRPILLVVEDNDDIREYIKDSLKEDFNIECAINGKDGLDKALKYLPDIVISDIMMPEMDGIELCRSLKEDMRTSHIPVILLTAKDTTQDKEEGYENGADSYLTKPFSAKLLRTRIKNILDGRKRLSKLLLDRLMPTQSEKNNEHPNHEEKLIGIKLNTQDEKFISKLDSLIETNMKTEKIDMAFLTDNMNMSHSTFYRKLKVLTGLTPVDYVKKFKLKKSIDLLKGKELNITEISYLTGFNSAAHYREAFKDVYGITPSQYLKKNKD